MLVATVAWAAAPSLSFPRTFQTIAFTPGLTSDVLDRWHSYGVDAFFLTGLEPLTAAVPDRDKPNADSIPPAIAELRRVVDAAHAAGIGALYARTRLVLPATAFGDSKSLEPGLNAIRRAARLCELADMTGLVLDVRAQDSLYRFVDAADEKPTDRATQRDNARAFGEGLARACESHCELNFVVDDLFKMGPLWFDVVDGVVSTRHDRTTLFARVGFDVTDPDEIVDFVNRQRRLLGARLSEKGFHAWQEHGQICFGILPYTVSKGVVTLRLPVETLRSQIATTRVVGSRGVWVEAEPSDVSQTPDANEFSLRSPLDSLEWVGPLETADAENVFVFRGPEGAAIMCPSGLLSPLSLDRQSTVVTATNLVSGVATKINPDKQHVVVDASPDTLLIEGLPIRDWATPAGISVSLGEPRAEDYRSAAVNIAWSNHTGVTVAGRLELAPEGRFAITPSGVDVDTVSGARAELESVMSGPFSQSSTVNVRAVLATPKAVPVVREFAFDVPPRMRWTYRLDGTAPVFVAAGDLDSNGVDEIIATSSARDLVCVDESGALRWKRLTKAPLVAAPIVFRHWSGDVRIAALDGSGLLECFHGDGTPCDVVPVAQTALRGSVLTANLHAFPGEEIVVGESNGKVLALLANEQVLWTYSCEGPVKAICRVVNSASRDSILVWTGGAGLKCVGADGLLSWETMLPALLTCSPIAVDLQGDGRSECVVALENGSLCVMDTSDGTKIAETALPKGMRAKALNAVRKSEGAGCEVVVSAADSLVCYSSSLKSIWTSAVGSDNTVLVLGGEPRSARVIVGQSSGICAVNWNGELTWCDSRPVGSVVMASVRGRDGNCGLVYVGDDGVVRWVTP